MNVHHLELFYYVARFGGITEAVRRIPYGIQQPAVSSQVSQLEQSLGTILFHRRPFALTPAGGQLFAFIEPFFGNLEKTADQIRNGLSPHARIGASEVVLRDHLPRVIEAVRAPFPNLRVTLRQGHQPELEQWLRSNDLDLAVTVIERKAPPGIRAAALMELPLVLLVPKKSPFKSTAQFFKQARITETLIALPPNESITKTFQDGLRRRDVDWPIGMEVSSLLLIEAYVENGYGIGLSVLQPEKRLSKGIRALPLEGFSPVTLGALWCGKATPLTDAFIRAIRTRAEELMRAQNSPPPIRRGLENPGPPV